MSVSFMVTDIEIAGLFYLKDDRKIAEYLGVTEDRVKKVRAQQKRAEEPTVIEEPKPLPRPLEEAMAAPLVPASVLTPPLCPTCGAPCGEVRLMVTHIQALVAAYYKIPVREMTSDRRHRHV